MHCTSYERSESGSTDKFGGLEHDKPVYLLILMVPHIAYSLPWSYSITHTCLNAKQETDTKRKMSRARNKRAVPPTKASMK
jgi:hypothetical protein